mmetsp:Transcript_30599/g.69659  ORF Transcript_30599/g.69659 Transcript_30599/m.69659 type:complete len:296 (-) Transcript_30599:942-1829(-)
MRHLPPLQLCSVGALQLRPQGLVLGPRLLEQPLGLRLNRLLQGGVVTVQLLLLLQHLPVPSLELLAGPDLLGQVLLQLRAIGLHLLLVGLHHVVRLLDPLASLALGLQVLPHALPLLFDLLHLLRGVAVQALRLLAGLLLCSVRGFQLLPVGFDLLEVCLDDGMAALQLLVQALLLLPGSPLRLPVALQGSDHELQVLVLGRQPLVPSLRVLAHALLRFPRTVRLAQLLLVPLAHLRPLALQLRGVCLFELLSHALGARPGGLERPISLLLALLLGILAVLPELLVVAGVLLPQL